MLTIHNNYINWGNASCCKKNQVPTYIMEQYNRSLFLTQIQCECMFMVCGRRFSMSHWEPEFCLVPLPPDGKQGQERVERQTACEKGFLWARSGRNTCHIQSHYLGQNVWSCLTPNETEECILAVCQEEGRTKLIRLDTHLALWIHLTTCLLLALCSSHLDLFLPQFLESTTEFWHFHFFSLNCIQMFAFQGCLLPTPMVPHITIHNTHFIAFIILFDKWLSP